MDSRNRFRQKIKTLVIVISLISISTFATPAKGADKNITFLPFIPENKEQIELLDEQIEYRQERIKDHKLYVASMRTKLTEIKKKKKSVLQERKRSAVALRIVRIGSQIEADRLRVLELQGRIEAAHQKVDLEKAKMNGKLFPKLHQSARNVMTKNIQALISELEPDITETNSLNSLNKLKTYLQQESEHGKEAKK